MIRCKWCGKAAGDAPACFWTVGFADAGRYDPSLPKWRICVECWRLAFDVLRALERPFLALAFLVRDY